MLKIRLSDAIRNNEVLFIETAHKFAKNNNIPLDKIKIFTNEIMDIVNNSNHENIDIGYIIHSHVVDDKTGIYYDDVVIALSEDIHFLDNYEDTQLFTVYLYNYNELLKLNLVLENEDMMENAFMAIIDEATEAGFSNKEILDEVERLNKESMDILYGKAETYTLEEILEHFDIDKDELVESLSKNKMSKEEKIEDELSSLARQNAWNIIRKLRGE